MHYALKEGQVFFDEFGLVAVIDCFENKFMFIRVMPFLLVNAGCQDDTFNSTHPVIVV
jgi:hypothetical protein